jgi:predicted alpha/beta superfamily hydrolase
VIRPVTLATLLAAACTGPRHAPAIPTTPAAADSGRTLVLSLASRTFGNTRAIRVHLPPGHDASANARRRYPVLYMNDGFAVFSPRLWSGPRTVDSLIAAGAIEPIVLVGIDNAASIPGAANPSRDRANEYLPYADPSEPALPDPQGRRYPAFVVEEVMPLVARHARVSDDRARTAVGGSSYGGIAALHTLHRHPRRFGALLLESTPTFLSGGRLVRESASIDPPPVAVYVGIGTRETDDSTLLAAAERESLEEVLRAASPRTRIHALRVEGARHEAAAWRARFPAALVALFGVRR